MIKKIIGIYLAAGQATRFGRNKLTMPFGKGSLGAFALTHAIESKLDKIIVVVGANTPLHWLHSGILKDEKVQVTRCKESNQGQSFSIKCGLNLAEKMGADALLMMLADQPFVSKKLINQLINNFYEVPSLTYVSAAKYGAICPPVLISRMMFPQISHINGDKGAKWILEKERNHGKLIEVNDPYYLFDIDTKEDYDKALSLLK